MTLCQMGAAPVTPETFSIGVLSALPTHPPPAAELHRSATNEREVFPCID